MQRIGRRPGLNSSAGADRIQQPFRLGRPIAHAHRRGLFVMPRFVLALLVAGFAGPAAADPPPEAVALQTTVHKVIDAAEPSVACVLISRSDVYGDLGQGSASDWKLGGFNPVPTFRFMDGQKRERYKRLDLANSDTVPEAYGSGIVIDESGLVLTTYHVLGKDVKKIYVRLPGNKGSYADIVAADARADLAVLRLIAPPPGLKAVKFGDGAKARKGDWVIALANPFAAGFKDGSPSASWGILSNVRRRGPGPGPGEEIKRVRPFSQHNSLLQTDARLALGSSGGALFNLNGEMIGLTTALAAVTGGDLAGGYAIPLDANAKNMIEVLKRGEEIEYGFLGVTVDPEERSVGRGVFVRAVAPGHPAARAGLQPGDQIVAINGSAIREQDDLFFLISAALAGTEAKVEVLRGGQPRTFEIRLAKAKPTEAQIVSNPPKPVFGLKVDYTSTLSLDAGSPDGVAVKEIEPGSAAEKKLKEWAGQASLIVIAVNGRPVVTPAEFYKEAAGKPSVRLTIVEAARRPEARRGDVTLP
jgi:serine protease Do